MDNNYGETNRENFDCMPSDHLHILWTSDNPITAHYMVFMYAVNALTNRWWEKVTVIIWGASAKLAATDETVRERIKMAQELGVVVTACYSCAIQLGVLDELHALGIETVGWGKPLSELLRSNAPLITI
ncbi:MAG: DsrE family protein [Oscillospiraceae bacterium]|nr:DsrE family protein [Oscillospiraceae bacterium]